MRLCEEVALFSIFKAAASRPYIRDDVSCRFFVVQLDVRPSNECAAARYHAVHAMHLAVPNKPHVLFCLQKPDHTV